MVAAAAAVGRESRVRTRFDGFYIVLCVVLLLAELSRELRAICGSPKKARLPTLYDRSRKIHENSCAVAKKRSCGTEIY